MACGWKLKTGLGSTPDTLKQSGFAAPTVNQAQCIKCGKCVRYCPMSALSLQ